MYDPFARGPYPVGVRSAELTDETRAHRKLPLEIWYPASSLHAGQDLAKQTQDRYPILGGAMVSQEAVRDAAPDGGRFPLVIFSHGFAGHRRQSTFFCTHLASQGYLVIALDHGGNTLPDVLALSLRLAANEELPANVEDLLGSFVFDRPRDVSVLLDAIAQNGVPELPFAPDTSEVALSGHSFGGWTTLVTARHDPRVRVALALAPAGGPGPLAPEALQRELVLDFDREVETLYLALERDTLLPLAGIEHMFRRTQKPARMLVLKNADHMHFCDRVERSHEFFRVMPQIKAIREIARRLPPMSELVPGAHGYAFANAMATAQLDAVLKRVAEGRTFLEDDVVETFARRGIVIEDVL